MSDFDVLKTYFSSLQWRLQLHKIWEIWAVPYYEALKVISPKD